ncbi:MAG: cellulase family glycosylhydrolase [Planctomycetaceae bacterium]|jgi:hypothetical protein|nr:cellulase family glycosylhydrolase [Planctomycetaceae bacterium]
MKKSICLTLFVCTFMLYFVSAAVVAVADNELFPFAISFDTPKDGINMSSLLDAPAGKYGFVRVQGDKFVTDNGEIRFWATNLSGRANFPEKDTAEKLADRLAQFGFNCVRLHHMDSWAIWGDKPKSQRKIDPVMLDKLDYLIAALKKRGIYVNINLHVGRWLDDRDGFPHKDKRPKYDKGLDNFEPQMIELQKEYAKDLLTHVNPYTGLAYNNEPAVAMVEINNENSVVIEWASGNLDELPNPYGAEFQKQWNDWLRKKYQTTKEMLQTWNCVNEPLGDEIIHGGDFSKPLTFDGSKGWYFQCDDKEQAECSVVPDEKLVRVVVHREGKVSWTPQLMVRKFKIEKNKPYTLSFRIRSDKPISLRPYVAMDVAPWENLGMSASISVTPEWKTFQYHFFGTQDYEKARFTFTGLKPGTVEIAGVTLRTGGNFGIDADCTLEKGNVPILKQREIFLSEEYRRDFWQFLVDIEWNYWLPMSQYLKSELKVKSPISGTQLYYGSKHVQAALDYCDDHAYWNHPAWLIKQWDSKDWYILNRALVNFADKDIFTRLGTRRIAGKPHTVSEYNHPVPNQFSAEGLPMICAFAQFQGWNGIFQYTYAHEPNIEPEKFTGYFDMIAHAGQLVHAPACAAIILRGDVARAGKTILGSLDQKTELDTFIKNRSPRQVDFKSIGLDYRLTLLHGTALDLSGKNGTNPQNIPVIPQDQKVFVSDTGELTWNLEEKDAGYFTLNTPKTKIFSGFIRNRKFKIGDIELSFGKTRLDWATVSLTEVSPNQILVAATGFMENTGMKFERYDDTNPERMTVRNNWGNAPILCEGIPLTLEFPANGKTVHCFALNPAGQRKEQISKNNIINSGKTVLIKLTPETKTLWYEIVPESFIP